MAKGKTKTADDRLAALERQVAALKQRVAELELALHALTYRQVSPVDAVGIMSPPRVVKDDGIIFGDADPVLRGRRRRR